MQAFSKFFGFRPRPFPGLFFLLWMLWIAWGLGRVFRDATLFSGWLFFIPSPVVALACFAAAGRAWTGNAKKAAAAFLLAGMLPAGWFFCAENRFLPRSAETGTNVRTLRLVHWNVAHGRMGRAGIFRRLRKENADLYVLSEPPKSTLLSSDLPEFFGKEFSGILLPGLAIAARGRLRDGEWLAFGEGIKVYGVTWDSPEGPLRLLAIDSAANVGRPRDPMLQRIRRILIDQRADLMAGDFNAPRCARALHPLPPGYAHAYEAAGRGCSATWPVPIPLYAIDQCVFRRQTVRPGSYRLKSSWRSDHRMQVFDFRTKHAEQ